jgi:hypothetical protein
VDWSDSADSRVRILATALGDLHGIWRVGWGLLLGKLRLPAVKLDRMTEGSVR